MSRGRQLLDSFKPWAGLVIGLLALAVVHQFGSDSTFNDCRGTSPVPLLIVAVLGLILVVVSGLASSDSPCRYLAAGLRGAGRGP
jgi:hypothetical protein